MTPQPESITVSPTSITMRVGETATISATVLPPEAAQEVDVTAANPDIIAVTTAEPTQGA